MDFLMGMCCKDFVVVCADTNAQMSQILTIKHDEDKIVPIDSHKVMALAGQPGDRSQFSEFIIANVRLYALRNSRRLSTHAVANFTRNELATSLRKKPYNANMLIAGYDESCGPSLYWMDYLATLHKTNVAGMGYGSYFALSLFDRYAKVDMEEKEAVALMARGVQEVISRITVAPSDYVIKVVDKNGTRTVETISPGHVAK
ncbi:unnamed protein product [Ostreobium quekettii]|uniref:Proteasome subunit beta n=1 Tax=Ostreobium quekettii TaxID=121088 RepID=A0A8S1JE37_9CHLO|nr:unnamed protein product [Ostreobium quekettii]|eukprot:evm.model.scf_994EXC.2 EVM.evm.TU.scf_994EXC.2   scf_994EXC:6147-6752(-)